MRYTGEAAGTVGSRIAESPVGVPGAVHVLVAVPRRLPVPFGSGVPFVELVKSHLDLWVGKLVGVALRGGVARLPAPCAPMDPDGVAVLAAHGDAWKLRVLVAHAAAALATGLVVDLAEGPRAWVVVARLVLGEEAELGCRDHVQPLLLALGCDLRCEFRAGWRQNWFAAWDVDDAVGAEELVAFCGS